MADGKFVLPSDLPEEPAATPVTAQPKSTFVLPSDLPPPPAEPGQHAERTNTTLYDYPAIYQEMRRESQEQVGKGLGQLKQAVTRTGPEGDEGNLLWGLGNTGLGALGYITSPINAAYRAVIGEPVEQRTGIPKELTEFGAQLATPGLGLKSIGKPLTPATKVKPPREGPAADEARLYTKEGQETQAGLALKEAAKGGKETPEQVRTKLADVEEIIPGSEPTTFQASGNYGLGQLERGVQTKAQAPFQERRAEQAAARQGALDTDVVRPGNPEEVANELRARMAASDAAAEAFEQAAVARAQQQTEAAVRRAERAGQSVLGTNTPEIYGQVLRRELDEANNAARTNERTLWQAVDPDNRLSVNTGPVVNTEFRIYRDELTQAGAASLTDVERRIGEVVQRYGQAVPFREMQDLRSFVSGAMRQELRTSGNSPAYARLSRLRGAIEESVSAPFEPGVPAGPGQAALSAGAADRLAEATTATRQRAETFKQQPIKGVLQREGATGPYPLTNAAVPGRLIPSGPKGYDHVNAYLRATEGRPGGGLQEIRDAMVADMRAHVTDVDGNLDPGRLMSWARSKQDALRAVTERDGGVLARQLEEIQQSGFGVKAATKEQARTVKEAAAQRAAISKKGNEGIFGDLMGVRDKEDISKLLGSVFGSKTAVADAREIMSRLTTPEAQDGARRAITDWITSKLVSNTAAGTTDINILRADQFQSFIRHNGAVLREFGFTPEQIKTMELIAKDMRRAKMSIDATKIPGGSNTAQDLYAMKKFGLQGSNLSKILHLLGGATGGLTAGPLGAAVGFLSAGRVKVLRDRGINSVQELIVEGMVDPAVGHMLLGKTLPQEKIAFWKTVRKFGARAARTSILTGGPHPDQSAPAGYADGGAVQPLGREGIKARNKARAVAARERSSLARGAAQAKREVGYAEGGFVPLPRPRPGTSAPSRTEFHGEMMMGPPPPRAWRPQDELAEGQVDKTARGGAWGSDPSGSGRAYESTRGDIIAPQNPKAYPLRNVTPNDALPQPELGKLTPLERRLNLNPLEQDYHRSFGAPAAPDQGLEADPAYPVYADGGLTRGSEGDVGDAAALFANNPTIDAIERMHQARKRAQGIDQPPPPPRVDTAQQVPRRASGGSVNADSGKATKKSVNYSKGMPKAHCGICTHFSKGTCSEVKGTIYASMWCELFKRKGKYQEGGLVEEEDPLEAEKRRRNVPGGLGATAGSTVTSTTPVQDIPAPKVNSQGETLPTYVLKEVGKNLISLPERTIKEAGDLQRRGEYGGSHEDMPGFQAPGEMPAALETTMNLYGLNAPFVQSGLGIFGGKGAKTANLPMLKEAERMLKEGVPHETIRNRTGWEFGADGKPRFEISDAELRIKPEHPEDRIYEADAASRATGFRPNQRMEQQIEHPAAYEAYPWLKDMRTSLDINPNTVPGASYAPPTKNQKRFGKTGEIEVTAPTYEKGGVGDLFGEQKYSDTSARDMLLHEMQHAIQEREGFSPGANPRDLPLSKSEVTGITQRLAEKEGVDWANTSPKEREKMERVVRYRMYKAHAGETEARNVQTRADDTLRQRPSWKTEDVKREHQLLPKTGRLKPGEKPFADAKVYKSEYEPKPEPTGPIGLGQFPTTTPRRILKQTKEGGYSVRVPTGERPTEGLMMGVYRNTDPRNLVVEGRAPTQADVMQHAKTNLQALQMPERHYGTWKDPESGITYFDVSQRFPAKDIRQATKFGERTGQISGYDVGKGDTFPVGNWEKFVTDPEFHNRVIEQAQKGREYLSQFPAKEWWDMHGGPFEDVYGTQNMPQTAGLTASTAPNTKPIENLQHMSEYMRRHIRGEPVVQPTWRAPEGLMSLAAGKKMPLEQSRIANLRKSAAGNLNELQRRKVRSEALAMMGDPRAVVLDRHWARLGEAPERGIYTDAQEGVISSVPRKTKLSPYEIMENEVIGVADRMARDPRDFSADAWTGIRETIRTTGELYGQKFRASAIQGESKSYADHFVDLIQRKAGMLRMSVQELERRLRGGDVNLLSQMLAMPTIAGAYSYWLAGQGQEQTGSASSAGNPATAPTL